MEKFTVYTGKSVPLMNDNIDTDQLIPKQFLKAVDKKGFGKNLMFEWRYLNFHSRLTMSGNVNWSKDLMTSVSLFNMKI